MKKKQAKLEAEKLNEKLRGKPNLIGPKPTEALKMNQLNVIYGAQQTNKSLMSVSQEIQESSTASIENGQTMDVVAEEVVIQI